MTGSSHHPHHNHHHGPSSTTTSTTTTTTTHRTTTTTTTRRRRNNNNNNHKQDFVLLKGCDTFVAFPPTSPNGIVVFGKNSDRPCGEGQSLQRYHRKIHSKGTMVSCTYISIPQALETYAVLLSQIDWMWGAEHGTNEYGVVIGNEAVWTLVDDEDNDLSTKRLLGMDLVRLGLERGQTAYDAMTIMTQLLEVHGQGGPCSQDDDSFTYHNSFLIADSQEAWILETAGRQWVAERISNGYRNISNTLTIRTNYDLHSSTLYEYAKHYKLWNGFNKKDDDSNSTTTKKLDWAQCFGDGCVEECQSPYSRQSCGTKLLAQHANNHSLNARAMMTILRDHPSGICMHGGGFETTASMVSELYTMELLQQQQEQEENDCKPDKPFRHWMINQPTPCQHEYVEQSVVLEPETKTL